MLQASSHEITEYEDSCEKDTLVLGAAKSKIHKNLSNPYHLRSNIYIHGCEQVLTRNP